MLVIFIPNRAVRNYFDVLYIYCPKNQTLLNLKHVHFYPIRCTMFSMQIDIPASEFRALSNSLIFKTQLYREYVLFGLLDYFSLAYMENPSAQKNLATSK